MCTVNCHFTHSIVSLHLCKEFLTVVESVLTPDKVMNVLVYGLLRSDQIQYVGERVKWS